jgi:hypothetical protein
MSRIEPSRLADIQEVLGEVRSWPGIDDRGGGTFYLHRKPFLHFHAGRDRRRADIRGADGWIEIDLPEPLPAAIRQHLVAVLRAEHVNR